MDSPQAGLEVAGARAVSSASILNGAIIPHSWENRLELSSPQPQQLESIQLMK